MKNVLIIAYYFPPSGGPGVQRVLKHTRYLREFGWEPTILTVANGQFPARDESLLEQVPDDIEVVRTHIYEPYDIYRFFTGKKKGTAIDVNVIKKESQKLGFKEKIAEFIRATFFIPDARMAWQMTANKAVAEIVKRKNIDAVYSSSPPYTCSLIARNAKRAFRLPWVAGFRDPWTEFLTTPKRWAIPSWIDRRMEKSVFSEADAVESAWIGITSDAIGKYPDLDESKFHHVPNGFDSADFPSFTPAERDKFTLTYTGSMYGRRNPDSLFKAVQLLIDRNEIDIDDIHFRFVGRFGAEVEEMFEKASFKDKIETISYVPHEESIKLLMDSDVSMLIVDEAKESENIVPGKVYEYVGVMRPILAVAPVKSAIADLLAETKSGLVAHQSQIEEIAKNFLQYYKLWKEGKPLYNPEADMIKQYERRENARTLANLLNGLTEK